MLYVALLQMSHIVLLASPFENLVTVHTCIAGEGAMTHAITYLSLSHQFPLQVVDLEEGAPRADGSDCAHRPAAGEAGFGDGLELLHPSVLTEADAAAPAATVHVAAAEGVGLVEPAVQDRGFPQGESLQVPVGGGPQ